MTLKFLEFDNSSIVKLKRMNLDLMIRLGSKILKEKYLNVQEMVLLFSSPW